RRALLSLSPYTTLFRSAPTLKRTIDLVRIMAAAELLKNPGHDVGAVASVLGFASSSHLSTTARRVAKIRPTSLARLRGIDLIRRDRKSTRLNSSHVKIS